MKVNDLVYSVFLYFVLFVLIFTLKDSSSQSSLKIHIWDVGQGDSALVVTPNGNKILIDGGDNFESDFKLSMLVPFFSCEIDVVVLTHPHSDHIRGLNRIAQRCKVFTVIFNDVDYTSQDYLYFKDLIKNLNVLNVYKGDEFTIDNVKLKILWPTKEFLQTTINDINETSIMIFLDYKNFEALFLGDAGSNDLSKVDVNSIKPLINEGLDILKVPHHGSKFGLNKEFYADLKPKNCIISVGKDNMFGHPSKEVVDFLLESKCNVLRTDERGDIVVTFR
ncbi:MBL fold metallo-hydrolase [candidate division WWE3 bacterium]|uniref:MBL fold metallo-hydrolase n=1 Tax=candidate division WWE3 bacterium TaxID=2053526 RepID=A0A7X9HSY6_UNCKA|nr:MBL fold metallo-hydrolase [candidate division WWE3 bacterium]